LLCYLEGQTGDQAAEQLGWSLRTLKRRLAGGKKLLRVRLARRGVSLSAGLFGAVLVEQAALPADLVHTTVQTVLLSPAGLASTPAAALARELLQAMFVAKLKIATVFLVTLSIAAFGISAVTLQARAGRQPEAALASLPQTPAQPRTRKAVEEIKTPTQAADEQEMTLTGRVVDAKGQPRANARLAVVMLFR